MNRARETGGEEKRFREASLDASQRLMEALDKIPQERMTTVTVTIEAPDIVASVLEGALDESTTALICPDSIFPGYQGRIVRNP